MRVGDESVLVARGEDGGLRAFRNVCRHRRAQLCPAERGQTRTLQCRYHAWTYGLDGRNLLPDHVIVHTLWPLAPDRSRDTCDWLFASDAVARPGFDPADTVALFDRVNRQDWEVCEWVQAGVRSRAFAAGGVYVPIEAHILGFNDFVLAQLGVPVDALDAGVRATPSA